MFALSDTNVQFQAGNEFHTSVILREKENVLISDLKYGLYNLYG